jgi:predicted dehydrogenase
MDVVRVGIVGVGGMGGSHSRLFVDGKIKRGELKAVCDINPKAMESFGDDIVKFDSSDALLASGLVDAVVVATPHYAHTTIGKAVLDAGLHLLVEKPISVHKADCERLIAAHTNEKQVFAAMFNQRTDPHYKAVKKLITSGELGEIKRVNWIITDWFRTQSYYDRGGWRATWSGEGGGVLLNQCPHQLDLLQWLCGKPTKIRAFCHIAKHHHIEVEDDVTAYLEWANGAHGVFVTTTGEAPGTNRLEVCGDRGKVVVEGGSVKFTRTEEPVAEWCAACERPFQKPPVWNVDIPVKGSGGQHCEVLQNFVDAILDGKELIAPAAEGINSVETGNAMLLSALTEQTVELPIDAAVYEEKLKHLIETSTFEKKTVEVEGDVDMSGSF